MQTDETYFEHTCSICGKNSIYLDTENWRTGLFSKTVNNPFEHFFEPSETVKICEDCWEKRITPLFNLNK